MKYNLLARAAAMLGTICMTLSALAVPVSAEEDADLMPSGKPFSWLERELAVGTDQSSEMSGTMPFASFETVVFQGDEIKYIGCFGESDRENHIPADENTVYEWGSISKTLTWVSAMQLWEQGLLDLEADIRSYLPENFLKNLRYDDPITMLNLMNHTGGWCESTYAFGTNHENKIPSLAEALQSGEPAQVFRPGEVTAYSNWGASLAAYIVECISGMDYCEYVHAHILEPLGLEHTSVAANYRDNAWVRQQRETMQSYQFSALGTVKALGSCMTYIKLYPAGAATGTVGDLARYAQALADDSAPLFEHPETQALMLSGSAFYGDSGIPSSCHGFAPIEYAVRTVGHDGSTIGYRSIMLFDPESKTGLVALTNDPGGNVLYSALPSMVFGSLSPKQYAEADTTESVTFDGYYLNSRACYAGLLKYDAYLGAIRLDSYKNLERIGTDFYQSHDPNGTSLIGGKHYSDGGFGLNIGAADYMHDPRYLPKLCLLAAYILTAIVSVYLLRIRRKLRKAGRWQPDLGGRIRCTAEIAKIVSLILIAVAPAFNSLYYGLPKPVAVGIGIGQIICMAFCIAAAICAVCECLKQSAIRRRLWAICSIAGNAVTVGAMVYFEMFRFWGC